MTINLLDCGISLQLLNIQHRPVMPISRRYPSMTFTAYRAKQRFLIGLHKGLLPFLPPRTHFLIRYPLLTLFNDPFIFSSLSTHSPYLHPVVYGPPSPQLLNYNNILIVTSASYVKKPINALQGTYLKMIYMKYIAQALQLYKRLQSYVLSPWYSTCFSYRK